MKVISIVSGLVAAQFTVEDVSPAARPPIPDYMAAIQSRYNFLMHSNNALGAPITFQNGRGILPDGRPIPFNQLQITRNTDLVNAVNTDEAEFLLTDFLDFIRENFGFPINARTLPKAYLSDVIVEFDADTKNILSSLFFIEKIINSRLPGERNLRQVSFGLRQEDPGMDGQATLPPLVGMANADFIIERRLGSDPKSNRFYCRAPLKTQDHIAILGEIENAISNF